MKPIHWRSKILLAAVEATYGTDAAPDAATDAVLMTQVQLSPMEGTDVDRDLELPYLGSQGTIPAELHMRLSFRVELEPSGTAGTPPAWGGLMRGCALAEVVVANTSVTYNPVTDDHESLTLKMYVGETLYVSTGARGNCMIRVDAQGIPYLEFAFTGLWAPASEAARPGAVDLSAYEAPKVASSRNTPVFTIDGTPLVMRSFALDLGNQVEPRFLVGSERIIIADRADAITTTVEAVPLTTLDPYALAEETERVPVVLQHGTDAGRIATLTAPRAQMQRPQGLSAAQGITEWPLRMVPVPEVGNDQWMLELT